MTNPPPAPQPPTPGQPPTHPQPPTAGHPQQPTGEYAQQPTDGYPQQPTVGYAQQPTGGYPQQPTDGYAQDPTGGYPQQATGGYPQHPAGGYPAQPAGGYPRQSVAGYPPQQGGSGYPQHLWPEHAQPRTAAHPPAPQRSKGSAVLGVLALLLAIAGLVAPFLPFSNLIDRFPVRQYLAFPFALPALALAITTLATNRRAKPAAAIGMMIAFLALIVGAIMIYNYDFRP